MLRLKLSNANDKSPKVKQWEIMLGNAFVKQYQGSKNTNSKQ